MAREIEVWACDYCGEWFVGQAECEAHEEECDNRPAEVDPVTNLLNCKCFTCAKYDNLMNYYPPECKMMHDRLPATQCDSYELTDEVCGLLEQQNIEMSPLEFQWALQQHEADVPEIKEGN